MSFLLALVSSKWLQCGEVKKPTRRNRQRGIACGSSAHFTGICFRSHPATLLRPIPAAAGGLFPFAESWSKLGPANALGVGLEHHRAGRLVEAEVWYRRASAADPNHPDALHLMGVVAHETGRHDAAVELISQAIRRNAKNAGYFSNLGNALHARGKHDEAVAAYRRAISIKPDYAKAQSNLGNALREP